MACYHFTIKTDQKPDGTKVSASTHVEYIAREGKYRDYEKEEIKAKETYKNSISGDRLIENTLEKPTLLYRSPFGSIIRVKDKIQVSDNASVETVAIALAISEKLYGEKINLTGTNTFKAQVLVAANEMDLNLHFADSILEQKYTQMKEIKNNGRKEFERNGGRVRKPKELLKPNLKHRTIKSITKTGFKLPKLSQCRMVSNGQKSDLLLSRDDDASLLYRRTDMYHNVRWDVSGARRGSVNKVANEILVNVQKQLDSVFAASHVQYINREAAFKQRGGCIYKNHHLPKWANDSPKKFFTIADQYERINGVRYKEIEFALPNELDLNQQKEIIEQFVENHLKDFYYAYAIHDKIGVMSTGEHNTHVHIMFSERKIDEAEKFQERSYSKFFAKAFPNAKAISEMRRGGAKKDPKWNGKDRAKYLCLMREDFAKIQNTILEKHDIPDRVDHRSLKAQMKEAIENGNMRLAELLNRMPEEHIGPDHALRKNNQKVIELLKYREYKAEHRRLLYAADLLENSLAENITQKETVNNTKKVTEITHTDSYRNSQEATIIQLKNDMLKALKDVHSLKRIAIWNQTAIDMAKLKFMTLEEREMWQNLKSLQEKKENWKTFKENLRKPSAYQQAELKAYNDLMPELDKQLNDLSTQIKQIAAQVEPIFQRLSTPIMQKKIQQEASKILWSDRTTKEHLKTANQNLDIIVEQLQQKIKQIIPDKVENNVFTAKQLEEIKQLEYDNLKSDYNKNIASTKKLESRVISYDRAIEMAKNQYVNGAFKKLREQYRVLNKKEGYLSTDTLVYQDGQAKFNAIKKPNFWQSKKLKLDYESKQQELLQKGIELSHRKGILMAEKSNLDIEKNRLNALCENTEGKSKIENIAMGILRKNQPIAEKHQMLMEKTKDSLVKMNHVKKQLQAIKKQATIDKNVQYAVVKNHPQMSSPSVIADALLGNPHSAQLVARIKPGTGEMDKDWSMMSEIEKDEKINSIENLDRY